MAGECANTRIEFATRPLKLMAASNASRTSRRASSSWTKGNRAMGNSSAIRFRNVAHIRAPGRLTQNGFRASEAPPVHDDWRPLYTTLSAKQSRCRRRMQPCSPRGGCRALSTSVNSCRCVMRLRGEEDTAAAGRIQSTVDGLAVVPALGDAVIGRRNPKRTFNHLHRSRRRFGSRPHSFRSPQYVARDCHAVDFTWSFVDAHHTHLLRHEVQRKLFRDAHRTERLHRLVDDLGRHLG